MTLSITHALVMITPDDPAYENKPSDWNAAHALSGAANFAQGGTNNSTTPGTGQVIFSDGTKLVGDANLTWDATTGLLVKKPISCTDTGSNAERFGAGARALQANDVVIGQGATSTASSAGYNTVIGQGSSVSGFGQTSVVIGQGNTTSASAVVNIGRNNSVTANYGVVLGANNTFNPGGAGAIGIISGPGAVQSHVGGMLIGDGASARDYELLFSWGQNTLATMSFHLRGSSDAVFTNRSLFRIGTSWIDSADATRKARNSFYVYDTAEREFLRADSTGAAAVNVALPSGGSFITQAAALGTTATDGFIYIPTSAGAPTGTPTAQTGTVAAEYDTTNDLLKIYNTAWKTLPTQATGSWTPADNSGAALTFTGVSANYTKIGNMVFAYFKLTYPVTASGANASISGLPFTIANADYATGPAVVDTSASITGGLVLVPVKNTTTANLDVGTPVGPVTNLQLSGASIAVMLIYPVT